MCEQAIMGSFLTFTLIIWFHPIYSKVLLSSHIVNGLLFNFLFQIWRIQDMGTFSRIDLWDRYSKMDKKILDTKHILSV